MEQKHEDIGCISGDRIGKSVELTFVSSYYASKFMKWLNSNGEVYKKK